MGEHGLTFTVSTEIHRDKIVQETSQDLYGHTENIQRRVIDLQEKEIRKALISLGWSPPEENSCCCPKYIRDCRLEDGGKCKVKERWNNAENT